MSTSGGTWVNALASIMVVVAALAVAGRATGDPARMLTRPPRAALAIWAVVAVPSLLQFVFPALLEVLSRRPELITEGQVWRLLSSLVVQDGGVSGTVSNLLYLYVVACAAVPIWGGVRTAVLLAVGAVGFNLLMTFAYPEPGAGNSGATFVVAATLPAAIAVWHRTWWAVAAVAVTAAAGAGLLVLSDTHGFAFLGGLVLGAVAAVADRRQTPALSRSIRKPS